MIQSKRVVLTNSCCLSVIFIKYLTHYIMYVFIHTSVWIGHNIFVLHPDIQISSSDWKMCITLSEITNKNKQKQMTLTWTIWRIHHDDNNLICRQIYCIVVAAYQYERNRMHHPDVDTTIAVRLEECDLKCATVLSFVELKREHREIADRLSSGHPRTSYRREAGNNDALRRACQT